MADTREFFIVCNDGTIFGSDPHTKYRYLDMSENSSLNDKATSTIYNFKNQFRVISDYDVTLQLTFDNRVSREEFALNYVDKVWAFGVTSRVDKSIVYTKRAMVVNYEYVNNDYTNGLQTEITLQLTGQWQSGLNIYNQPAPDDNGDGTKKYYGGSMYGAGRNLLNGTIYQTRSTGQATGWNINLPTLYTNRTDLTGKTYVASCFLHSDYHDVSVLIGVYDPATNSVAGTWGNVVPAGSSGYSTAAVNVPTGSYVSKVWVSFTNEQTDQTFVSWKALTLVDRNENLLTGTSSSLQTAPDSSDKYSAGTIYNFSTAEIANTSGKALTLRVYIHNTSSSPVEVTIYGSKSGFTIGSEVAPNSDGYSTATISSLNSSDTSRDISIRAYNANRSISGVEYKELKLENGSVATPWVPNIADSNYTYLMEASYQYYKSDENLNVYKYGSTNYSNQIKLATEDNQFIIYFVLTSGMNHVTIANSQYSVTLRVLNAYNGTLAPLGSEGINYKLSDRTTVDKFSLWNGGDLVSSYWTVDNPNDYFTLLTIFDNIKTDPVSIIAQGDQGATLPYSIYTYSKHDFI